MCHVVVCCALMSWMTFSASYSQYIPRVSPAVIDGKACTNVTMLWKSRRDIWGSDCDLLFLRSDPESSSGDGKDNIEIASKNAETNEFDSEDPRIHMTFPKYREIGIIITIVTVEDAGVYQAMWEPSCKGPTMTLRSDSIYTLSVLDKPQTPVVVREKSTPRVILDCRIKLTSRHVPSQKPSVVITWYLDDRQVAGHTSGHVPRGTKLIIEKRYIGRENHEYSCRVQEMGNELLSDRSGDYILNIDNDEEKSKMMTFGIGLSVAVIVILAIVIIIGFTRYRRRGPRLKHLSRAVIQSASTPVTLSSRVNLRNTTTIQTPNGTLRVGCSLAAEVGDHRNTDTSYESVLYEDMDNQEELKSPRLTGTMRSNVYDDIEHNWTFPKEGDPSSRIMTERSDSCHNDISHSPLSKINMNNPFGSPSISPASKRCRRNRNKKTPTWNKRGTQPKSDGNPHNIPRSHSERNKHFGDSGPPSSTRLNYFVTVENQRYEPQTIQQSDGKDPV